MTLSAPRSTHSTFSANSRLEGKSAYEGNELGSADSDLQEEQNVDGVDASRSTHSTFSANCPSEGMSANEGSEPGSIEGVEPAQFMRFTSYEGALAYYQRYARLKGFSVRVGKKNKGGKRMRFLCHR